MGTNSPVLQTAGCRAALKANGGAAAPAEVVGLKEALVHFAIFSSSRPDVVVRFKPRPS
jgi:hypothetical protein